MPSIITSLHIRPNCTLKQICPFFFIIPSILPRSPIPTSLPLNLLYLLVLWRWLERSFRWPYQLDIQKCFFFHQIFYILKYYDTGWCLADSTCYFQMKSDYSTMKLVQRSAITLSVPSNTFSCIQWPGPSLWISDISWGNVGFFSMLF